VPDLLLMSRCRGCRTVKRVNSARLGDAAVMNHDRRIVNSQGSHWAHGYEKDKYGHRILPYLAWHTPQRQYH
jgi:hypothetical protein